LLNTETFFFVKYGTLKWILQTNITCCLPLSSGWCMG